VHLFGDAGFWLFHMHEENKDNKSAGTDSNVWLNTRPLSLV